MITPPDSKLPSGFVGVRASPISVTSLLNRFNRRSQPMKRFEVMQPGFHHLRQEVMHRLAAGLDRINAIHGVPHKAAIRL